MKTFSTNTIEYKGYSGTVDSIVADSCFHGRILGITHVFTYEGSTFDELEEDFKNCIDDYLYDCK